jgi:hypothetical protein
VFAGHGGSLRERDLPPRDEGEVCALASEALDGRQADAGACP